MNDSVNSIFEKLNSEKIFFDSAIDKWKEISPKFDYKQKIEIIRIFSEKDVFRWLYLISYLLPDLAKEVPKNYHDFIELLKIIINKIRTDLSQGVFIDALIKIGEDSSNNNDYVIDELLKEHDYCVYAGYTLGGKVKNNLGYLEKYVKTADTVNKKIASMIAISTILKNKEISEIEKKIIIFALEKFTNSEKKGNLKVVATTFSFDFYNVDKKTCFKNLMNFASENDSRILYTIAERLWVQGLGDSPEDIKNEIQLIKICSKDENVNVLDRVMLYLSKKGGIIPNNAFEIIMDLSERDLDFRIQSYDFALNEMGKNNIDDFEKKLKEYIRTKTLEEITIYKLSFIIMKLFNYHNIRLTKFIHDLDETETDAEKKLAKLLKYRTRTNYWNLIDVLSEEILKWGQYPSNSAVFQDKGTVELIDFVLDTNKGPIVIEVKTYPKKIINNELPIKLKNQMIHLMKLIDSKFSLLIILNPEIDPDAKEKIVGTFNNMKIEIIQGDTIDKIKKQFMEYLKPIIFK